MTIATSGGRWLYDPATGGLTPLAEDGETPAPAPIAAEPKSSEPTPAEPTTVEPESPAEPTEDVTTSGKKGK